MENENRNHRTAARQVIGIYSLIVVVISIVSCGQLTATPDDQTWFTQFRIRAKSQLQRRSTIPQRFCIAGLVLPDDDAQKKLDNNEEK